MGKGNIRSMRFSDDVVKLIEDQPGDTFTAKFDYLIRKCVDELPEKERHLNMIQDLIKAESDRLNLIRKRANDLESNISRLSMNLHTFAAQTQQAVNNINRLVDECNTN